MIGGEGNLVAEKEAGECLLGSSEEEYMLSLQEGGLMKMEVVGGVAENTAVVGQVDMVDVVAAVQEEPVAAELEELGSPGLEHPEFDQWVENKSLDEEQKESDSEGTDLEVEPEVAESAGE